MNKVYLLLGSNLGNRLENLDQALQRISRQAGPIVTRSSIYETAPWGNANQAMFYNQVVEVRTPLEPHVLLSCLLRIETELGRMRNKKYGPRSMDIDILFYNEVVIDTAALTVPHPAIQNRRFTLVPLSEIIPDYIHPVLHKSVKQLLTECTDELAVTRVA